MKNLPQLNGSDILDIGAALGPKLLHDDLKGLVMKGTLYDPTVFWQDSGFYPDAPVDPSIEKSVEESGIDQVIAYYLPISIYGSANWGIRYLKGPMQSYINKHFLEIIKRHPDADYKAVSRMIFESVRRHELEHCVQEMTYLAGRPYALTSKDYSTVISQANLDLEPLATNFEVTDTPSTVGSRRLKNIVTIYLSEISRPHPYSNWNSIDVNQCEIEYEREVDSPHGRLSMKSVRTQVLSNKGRGFVLIPEILLP